VDILVEIQRGDIQKEIIVDRRVFDVLSPQYEYGVSVRWVNKLQGPLKRSTGLGLKDPELKKLFKKMGFVKAQITKFQTR
jgi:hypothetical protein